MVIVQICVGSACHLKGSQDVVEMFRTEIQNRNLEDEIVLAGSFCLGKCNRVGVTVSVNDDVYIGVTKESFSDFFKERVLPLVEADRSWYGLSYAEKIKLQKLLQMYQALPRKSHSLFGKSGAYHW